MEPFSYSPVSAVYSARASSRRPLTWAWALVPGTCLSVVIESWEVWDFYGAAGFEGSSVLGLVGVT